MREPALRRPTSEDFVGKTVQKFERCSDDFWRFLFTDGTYLEIHCAVLRDSYGTFGRAYMEVCEEP